MLVKGRQKSVNIVDKRPKLMTNFELFLQQTLVNPYPDNPQKFEKPSYNSQTIDKIIMDSVNGW